MMGRQAARMPPCFSRRARRHCRITGRIDARAEPQVSMQGCKAWFMRLSFPAIGNAPQRGLLRILGKRPCRCCQQEASIAVGKLQSALPADELAEAQASTVRRLRHGTLLLRLRHL